MSLNLISDAWIPVRRKDGSRLLIAPWQMADDTLAFPDWPRPDLNIACLELLIGLVFLADPPEDVEDWQDRRAPDPERLRARLVPFAPAFDLLGDGPRFLQDLEKFEAGVKDPNPPDMLFIDSGGEITFKKNADLFVKRGRYGSIDLGLAAMALYATQAFAYADSAKHKSSLRDNGPLVTLVDPGDGLWSIVWANIPYGRPADPSANELPWLRPTITSEKAGRQVFPHARSAGVSLDRHQAETFFGMPWRMRLVEGAGAVVGFVRKPFGTEYEGWLHPLSPYWREDVNKPFRAVKAPSGLFSYRNWLGVIAERRPDAEDTRRRAEVLGLWSDRSEVPAKVIVAGWAMDKAKAADFNFSRVPLVDLGPELANAMEGLVEAASIYAAVLRLSLKRVLPELKPGEGRALNAARETFFVETQARFEELLTQLTAVNTNEIALQWLDHLKGVATAMFNALAMPGLADRDPEEQAAIVAASRDLEWGFKGYGKLGGKAFQALGLPVPEQKRRAVA